MHFTFLILPQGDAPDSFVRKVGIEAFTQKIEEATPLPEYLFQYYKQKCLSKLQQKRRISGKKPQNT